jgi:predicted Rdx family selenoprotein
LACNAAAADSDWRVWLEAKFVAPAASAPIANAQRTLLAAGRWNGTQLTPFTRKEWATISTSWKAFDETTRAAASTDFQTVEISYKRDAKNVIEYGEMVSKQGLLPSAVRAPELAKTFASTIGEVLLIAIPSRTRAFVFPEFGGHIARYSSLIWDAYRETAYPVSIELFEIRDGAIKAVGLFEN